MSVMTLESLGLDKLTDDQKAELVGLLEGSLTDILPLTPAQLAEVSRRIAAMDADPSRGAPWEVVRDAARARSRARRPS